MSTEVTTMKSFEEKLAEKLRTDIGDLIPPELLAKLVQKEIERQFFYNPNAQKSWFLQEVAKVAEPIIKSCVADVVASKKDEIAAGIKAFLDEKNLLLTAMEAAKWYGQQELQNFAANLSSQIVGRMKGQIY